MSTSRTLRRNRLPVRLCVIILTLLTAITGGIVSAKDPSPPNVLLILADDLGYGQLSCYGGKETPTPHIDSIADGGVRFTDGYVTAATCSPSRAALVSGQYQQRFGFEFNTLGSTLTDGMVNTRGIAANVPTIADVLRKAGYQTALVGKWHLGFQEQFHPLQRGFDEFYGILDAQISYLRDGRDTAKDFFRGRQLVSEEGYTTDLLSNEAVNFIQRNSDRPFFLYLSYTAVHKPFEGREKDLKRFADVENPRMRAYLAMTVALDEGVGRVLETLRKLQLDDNTLIVFLSDNGAAKWHGVGDNGPFRKGKLYLFEGGVRVPFLMKWSAQIPAGKASSLPVSSLDLVPTIAAAARAELPGETKTDGVDLLPYLTGKKEGYPHQHLFWRNGPNRAVRRGQWKLIQAGSHVWLFDLQADPGEVTNLAEKHPAIVKELQQAFERWQKEMKAPAWPSRPNLKTKYILIDGVKYEIHV